MALIITYEEQDRLCITKWPFVMYYRANPYFIKHKAATERGGGGALGSTDERQTRLCLTKGRFVSSKRRRRYPTGDKP